MTPMILKWALKKKKLMMIKMMKMMKQVTIVMDWRKLSKLAISPLILLKWHLSTASALDVKPLERLELNTKQVFKLGLSVLF